MMNGEFFASVAPTGSRKRFHGGLRKISPNLPLSRHFSPMASTTLPRLSSTSGDRRRAAASFLHRGGSASPTPPAADVPPCTVGSLHRGGAASFLHRQLPPIPATSLLTPSPAPSTAAAEPPSSTAVAGGELEASFFCNV